MVHGLAHYSPTFNPLLSSLAHYYLDYTYIYCITIKTVHKKATRTIYLINAYSLNININPVHSSLVDTQIKAGVNHIHFFIYLLIIILYFVLES